MRPRSAHISSAWRQGPADFAAAATITQSAPRPPVRPRTSRCRLRAERVFDPSRLASSIRSRRRSVSNDGAALLTHQLRDELADEPQADHDDRFSQSDVRRSNGMQRDAAERCKARLLQRQLRRHRHDQIARGLHGLGMARALAAERDPLTGLDIGDGRMDLGHYSRTRVTEHRVFVEFGLHFRESPHNACGLRHGGNLLKMGRVVPQLRHDAGLVQARRFGAATDQGVGRPNEDVVHLQPGFRYILDHDVLEAFSQNLLHSRSPLKIMAVM